MKKGNWLALSGVMAAFFAFQSGAHAQEAAPTPAQPAKTSAGTAESDVIVITAEKRAADLQTVPLAVSAFSGRDREKLGIVSVQDLTNYVPGVAYQTGLDRFYVRGVGRSSNNPGSDGGTAIYVDGVFTESSYAAATPNILMDSTQVLRGPQTTLWGRNAIGGALLINSKRPSHVQSFEGRALYGSFGKWEGGVRVTGPLPGTDKIRYAVTGDYWHQDDGYFNNVAGGKDEGANGHLGLIDGQLEADITSNLNAWLRVRNTQYNYSNRVSVSNTPYQTLIVPSGSLSPSPTWALAQWVSTGNTALNIITDGPLITQNPTFSSMASATGTPTDDGLRSFVSDIWGHQKLRQNIDVASQVSWDFAGTNLKYIGGAQHYYYELTSDFDGTNVLQYTIPVTTNATSILNNPTCAAAAPAIPCATLDASSVSHYVEDRGWWTHELDWSSTGDGPLQWLVGLFYYHEQENNPVFFPTSGLLNSKVVAPAGGPANPSGNIYYTNGGIESTSAAIFGQLDWNVMDTLKLTLGLRDTRDHKVGTEAIREIYFGGSGATGAQSLGIYTPAIDITPTYYPGLVGADGFARRTVSDSWSRVTGSLGAQWTPAEDTMFYARYDRGYKAGAFNLGTITRDYEVGAEGVDAYEVGAKARPLQGLTTNLAIFYYDWSGRQTPVSIPAGTVGTICEFRATNCSLFVNLKKSTSKGLELETNWTPFTDAHIRASYSYLDARVDEACCFTDSSSEIPTVAQDVAGAELPNSPENRYVIGADYTFRPALGSIFVGANYSWREHSYTEFFNTDFRRTPSYGVLNLTAVWNDPSGRFSIEGHVNNALDETGYEGVFASTKMSGSVEAGYTYTPELAPGEHHTYSTYGITSPRLWSVELRAKF
jgi:iron complex outermembrane receptor protein